MMLWKSWSQYWRLGWVIERFACCLGTWEYCGVLEDHEGNYVPMWIRWWNRLCDEQLRFSEDLLADLRLCQFFLKIPDAWKQLYCPRGRFSQFIFWRSMPHDDLLWRIINFRQEDGTLSTYLELITNKTNLVNKTYSFANFRVHFSNVVVRFLCANFVLCSPSAEAL